jgi:hypothetical protein
MTITVLEMVDLNSAEDVEIFMLILLLEMALLELDNMFLSAQEAIDCLLHKTRKRCQQKEVSKERQCWLSILHSTPDQVFRRMVRMKKEHYKELCDKINAQIGAANFLSEEYLPSDGYLVKQKQIGPGANSKRGRSSGERRVAIFIGLLAGASYLDLLWSFGVSGSTIYSCFL